MESRERGLFLRYLGLLFKRLLLLRGLHSTESIESNKRHMGLDKLIAERCLL